MGVREEGRRGMGETTMGRRQRDGRGGRRLTGVSAWADGMSEKRSGKH